MKPKDDPVRSLEESWLSNRSWTVPGGFDVRALKAAAQTDEEPFLLVRRLNRQCCYCGSSRCNDECEPCPMCGKDAYPCECE